MVGVHIGCGVACLRPGASCCVPFSAGRFGSRLYLRPQLPLIQWVCFKKGCVRCSLCLIVPACSCPVDSGCQQGDICRAARADFVRLCLKRCASRRGVWVCTWWWWWWRALFSCAANQRLLHSTLGVCLSNPPWALLSLFWGLPSPSCMWLQAPATEVPLQPTARLFRWEADRLYT